MPRPSSTLLLYLSGNALATTGMIAAITISAIAAERLLGDPTWSGLPVACSVLGTALGSHFFATLFERFGARRALAMQYSFGLLGGALAIGALLLGNVLLLSAGLFVLGFGHGATQYVRYLAADAFPPAKRAQALSWVVWMGTVGAVAGPALLAPTGRLAVHWSMPEAAGPYLAAIVCFAVTAMLYGIFHPRAVHKPPTDEPSAHSARVHWPAAAKLALLAMVVGHVVMVLVMTMTPIHLTAHGHGLRVVGFVISAHIAGMFLFAPAVGWLCDRHGPRLTLQLGSAILATSCLLSALSASSRINLPMAVPLFLLGFGWNFGFVGGSALLTSALPEAIRIRSRATADAAVWIAAAAASLSSSVLFARIGFDQLSWLGFVISTALLVLLAVRGAALRTRASANRY